MAEEPSSYPMVSKTLDARDGFADAVGDVGGAVVVDVVRVQAPDKVNVAGAAGRNYVEATSWTVN